MVYILDAYNIIHKIARLEQKLDTSLRVAREALINACGELVACRGDVDECIVVFDGNSAFSDLDTPSRGPVHIIYTESFEEADDRIIKILSEMKRPAEVMVVSDDNYVINHARVYRARRMNVGQFDELLVSHRAPVNKKKDKDFPKEIRDEITDEYRQILGIE